MIAVASLIFAVVPMLLYLWAIWAMDRYDREPLSLLSLNFFWGALGAVFFAILFSIVTSATLGTSDFEDTIFVAPIVEEIMKGVFILWTARDRRFDNITDGIVYGMAIGLGFGMTENFLYFIAANTPEEWVMTVVIRTLFSAVMHGVATGIFGASVGITKFELRKWKFPLRLVGLFLAMLLHFAWNFSVSFTDLSTIAQGFLLVIASVIAILVLIQVALSYESRLIHRELTSEVEDGLIPSAHLNYLPFSGKRKLLGWLSPAIDRKAYVQSATLLAFRKSQSRHCREDQLDQYNEEVESIRASMKEMLNVDLDSPTSELY